MNAVDVHNVTKVFPNGTRALHEVSLSVPEGQMIALVGLSGSGKSTLLRHINGLLLPTSGTVRTLSTDVGGASRRQLRELRRDVGFVFQQFGLVGRISAMENVLSGSLGSLKGPRFGVSMYPKALRRQALENLDRVGLANQAFQRADTLSGGQMQRVAIARSLMQSPKLLLADEPVASLDPESSSQVMDILFRIVIEDQLTVICTLHQVELAMGWAKRIVGLRDGVVVLDQMVSDIEQSDVMEVYRRVEPERAPQELTINDKSSSTGVSHP